MKIENIEQDQELEFDSPKETIKDTPTIQPKLNKDLPKGVILKRTREKKGLSLEAVHEATKVPMDALRSIEEGYTIRTLSPFYHKGFIKIYAQYLNLDISQVVEERVSKPASEQVKKIEFDDYGIQNWISKTLTKKLKQQIVIGVGILLTLFVLFKVISFFVNRPFFKKEPKITKSRVEPKAKPVVVSAPVEKNKPKASSKPQESTQQNQAPQTPPAKVTVSPTNSAVPTVMNVVLTVRAREKSWLRVKADAEVVFQSTLDKGEVETWRANDSIEISGRNISELEFELNGNLIGTLGRADRKAKQVIITKDGLSVTQ